MRYSMSFPTLAAVLWVVVPGGVFAQEPPPQTAPQSVAQTGAVQQGQAAPDSSRLSKDLEDALQKIAKLQADLEKKKGQPRKVQVTYRIAETDKFSSDTEVVYLIETSDWVELSGTLVRRINGGSGGEFNGESSSRGSVNTKHILRFSKLAMESDYDLQIEMSMPGNTVVEPVIDRFTEKSLQVSTEAAIPDATITLRSPVRGDIKQDRLTVKFQVSEPSYVSFHCVSRAAGSRGAFKKCPEKYPFSPDRFQNPVNEQKFDARMDASLDINELSAGTEYKFLPRVASVASGEVRQYEDKDIDVIYTTLPADFRSKGPLTLSVDSTGSLSLSTTIDSTDVDSIDAQIKLGAATVNLGGDAQRQVKNCTSVDCTVTVTFPFESYVSQFASFLENGAGGQQRPVFSMRVADSIGRLVAFDLSLAMSRTTAQKEVSADVKKALETAARQMKEKRGVKLRWQDWLDLGLPMLGALL